ncbi:glycosyltransferase family 4 protein [Noviherbaspirillum sp.]|uniref:glycosyltransferase family 4 protein n=1 Tax=Noviherbaspirillum sp. TaxID=1926288 RepID=UPI002FE2E419
MITTHAPSLVNFRAPLIRALRTRGLSVLALAPNFDERTRKAVEELGATPVDCPMSRTGMNPIRDALNTFKMAKLLEQLKPDITLGYFIKPVIFGAIAAWWAGVPRRISMIEGLGFVFTSGGGSNPLKRRMLKRLVMVFYRVGFKFAQRVVFLNTDDLRDFVEDGLIPPSKAFLLGPIGVDLQEWSVAPPVTAPVTFLLAARLLREKGIEYYADAARIVKERHPHARFILLGDLDENPGSLARRDVVSWVAQGLLEWPGHVVVAPWMAQASVFVLPSYYREGVPASTQEAMAMGRAVITTPVPGCRETVIDGVNGFFVPVQDATALAAAMCRFIEHPEYILSMGAASRRFAEEWFDADEVNRRLIDLLLEQGR